MPKNVTCYRVFIASPSDVEEERGIAEQVVGELNTLWSDKFNIMLQLISQSTYTYPDIGDDAQAVINEQINDDYDIFIGIMWSRFGTPTGRADSGTAEEFERAFARANSATENQVKIMFYFKDAPIKPSEIDAEQMQKVQQFKQDIEGRGVLTWPYIETQEFEKFLRMHLIRHIQEFQSNKGELVPGHPIEMSIEPTNDETREEAGYLDLIESGIDSFEISNSSLLKMTEALNELNSRITDRAVKLQSINVRDVAQSKSIINQAAGDMESFVSKMEAEIPVFSDSFMSAVDNYTDAGAMLGDFGEIDREVVKQAIDTTGQLSGYVSHAIGGLSQLREVIAKLPRITTIFNRAKRITLSTLDQLLEQLSISKLLVDEAESVFKQL
jgi:hypothetical protein